MAEPPRIFGIDASRAARARRTGTETYALELIRAMAPQADADHRLRLYTDRPPQPADWPAGPYIETRVMAWPRLWTHLRLAFEIARHPPDVLFVPAHVLPLYCPVPAVVTVHDLGYWHYPQAHRRLDRWYLHWTTERHTRRAAHILADSEATRQDLLACYGADPGRISVVYLGRDESLGPVSDPQAIERVKARYGIEGDYLLYLGTLQPRKNLVRLIDAFFAAISFLQDKETRLVIAGKQGWLYGEILAQARLLGITDQILFPGYVADEDKAALLSGSLAYLYPSLYEGFGLPVLEAMACGTPVLTSNCSSLPEVAGQAALLVDPHDISGMAQAIIRLMSEESLRRRLIQAGYRRTKQFSWEKAAGQVWQILRQVADYA